MILNPVRLFRRWRRLRAAVHDEAARLRRFHADNAAHVAAEKLNSPNLTSWGRLVMKGALRELRHDQPSLALATNAPRLPPVLTPSSR